MRVLSNWPVRFSSATRRPDALIEAVDHRGENLHAAHFELAVAHVGPGAALLRGGFPAGVDQAELFHLRDAGGADGVVAGVVAAAIFGEVGGFGVHRPVRGGVGDVQEERLSGVVAGVVGDEAGGVVVDGVGVVKAPRLVFRVCVRRNPGVVAGERVGVEKAAGAVDRAVEAVEAALERPVVLLRFAGGIDLFGDVPLADHVGAVAGGLECLGDREAAPVEVAAIAVEHAIFHHVADAGLVRVEAGEERGAGRAAAGRVVELGEAHAAAGQAVEVGRFDFAAVAAEIGVAHVVRHNEDDVGPRRGGGGGAGGAEERAGGEEGNIHGKKWWRQRGGARRLGERSRRARVGKRLIMGRAKGRRAGSPEKSNLALGRSHTLCGRR